MTAMTYVVRMRNEDGNWWLTDTGGWSSCKAEALEMSFDEARKQQDRLRALKMDAGIFID